MMRHLALIWRSEAVRYLFFGACTTLVNILCFSYFAGILRFPKRFISRDKIR